MKLREKFKTILRDKDGNMAIMFALGGSVLVLAMGVAIDMSSLTGRASKLQSATDAAVLAATVSGEKAPGQLKKIAQTAFEENFDFDEGESLDLFSLKVLSNNELVLKTRLKKPTIFGGVIGKDELFVGAESATYLTGAQPLDIALVLDRTGSMAGANMAGLITAANNYVTDLENSGKDVRVSVVPFSDYINVGASNSSQSWLDIPSVGSGGSDVECSMESVSLSSCSTSSTSSSTTSGGSCSVSVSSSSSGGSSSSSVSVSSSSSSSSSSGSCSVSVSTSGSGTTTWSDVFMNASGAYCPMNTDPQESSGDQIEECTPKIAGENWFGCVGSRAAPYNVTAEYNGEKFPLIYDRTCGQPLTELTSNLSLIKTSVSSLTASGSTYIPAGLQWGWRTLQTDAPFEDSAAADRKKLLILMTDGENTRSQVGNTHVGGDLAAANSLTQSLCTAIKASGIDVATVSYSNGGGAATNSAMLSDCASSESLYFDATNPVDLKNAFTDATNQSNEVRLIR